MIDPGKCPSCGGAPPKIIKRYYFSRPANEEIENLTARELYLHIRLQVFFDRIWKKNEPAEIRVEFCGHCGLIYTSPRLSDEEVHNKYEGIVELQGLKRLVTPLDEVSRKERAEHIYRVVKNKASRELKELRVLDYGGAEGFNLVPFTDGNKCFLIVSTAV